MIYTDLTMSSLKDSLASYARDIAEILPNGYFYDFRQNVFNHTMEPRFISMFLDGDGNELVSKACAAHSSSMLGYNFFHWISEERELKITFQDGETVSYNKVLFEVKIPVLPRSNANMDIVLRNSEGAWLFIESKFLEYMNTEAFKISETYVNKPEAYYDLAIGRQWSEFISLYDTRLKNQYWPGIKQEMCHLIGLTNWMMLGIEIFKEKFLREKYEKGTGDIRFINLVYAPDKERFPNEYGYMEAYRNRYEDLHKQIHEKRLIPIGLKMEFMTYSDLWPALQQSLLPDGLKEYLNNHYMQFAE